MAITKKKVEKWAQKKNTGKLLKAITVEDAEIRVSVIKALGETKDENAMYTLINLLKDPDAVIRAAAVDALGVMANGRSLEFVRQLWNIETDESVREKAKSAISNIKANMANEERH